MKRFWTREEIETLAKLYPDTAARDIAGRLNRAVYTIYNKAQHLGLKKSADFLASPKSGRLDKARAAADLARRGYVPWSQEDIDILTRLYPDETAAAVQRVLATHSLSSVYNMAKTLKLEKSAAFLASSKSGRTDGTKGVSGRFKKGHVPANKGVKGYNAGGRSADTQFKRGGKPHNTMPVGSYRLDKSGNLQRKVREAKGNNSQRWRSVSELVWIEANGPVPAGHFVVFRPGMRTNVLEEITLDRVELVSRIEHMRRHTLHNYPKEIAHAIQVRGALNRKINDVQKHQRSA